MAKTYTAITQLMHRPKGFCSSDVLRFVPSSTSIDSGLHGFGDTVLHANDI